MTGNAPFHAHRGMFEDERTALVSVALHTGHLIPIGQADLARIEASVRLMTIHAVDCALLVFVAERFVESGQILAMAGQTKPVRPLGPQMNRLLGFMNAVTIGANYLAPSMQPAGKPRMLFHARVAGQADLRDLICRQLIEGAYFGQISGLNVIHSGAVTPFAGFRLPALLGMCIQDLVRILLKFLKIILMTGGTSR